MRIVIMTATMVVMAEWDDEGSRRPATPRVVGRGRPRGESWDRVVAYLRERGPATASEVAAACGLSRSRACEVLGAHPAIEPAGRRGRRVLYRALDDGGDS